MARRLINRPEGVLPQLRKRVLGLPIGNWLVYKKKTASPCNTYLCDILQGCVRQDLDESAVVVGIVGAPEVALDRHAGEILGGLLPLGPAVDL